MGPLGFSGAARFAILGVVQGYFVDRVSQRRIAIVSAFFCIETMLRRLETLSP